jgi:hypothetical protein
MRFLSILFTAAFLLTGLNLHGQSGSPENALLAGKHAKKEVTFLWTSSNEDVLDDYIFPHSRKLNQKDKWNQVTLVLAGPALRVVSDNGELLSELASLHQMGVDVEASRKAAEKYDVLTELRDIGVSVDNVKGELTANLQDDGSYVIDL